LDASNKANVFFTLEIPFIAKSSGSHKTEERRKRIDWYTTIDKEVVVRNGDGIPDASGRCPNTPNPRCYKEDA
jgi:hypothetical protein